MFRQGFRLVRLVACGILFLAALVSLKADPALADTWACPGPNQTELYTDRDGPGCRKLGRDSPAPTSKGSEQPPAKPSPSPKSSVFFLQKPPAIEEPKSSRSFPDAHLQVPLLGTTLPVEGQPAHAPKPWNSALVNLDVSHLAAGTGPDISSDQHFGEDSVTAFETAVLAAAKAVGYDPQYLKARLYVPRPPGLDVLARLSLKGQSAGIVWAVAVASAILGDQFRSDVCLSGTINMKLEVGPVGGLEDKIKACRQIKYRQLIFPVGQNSMDMMLQAKSYEITLTEVKTLAEAYEAATGQPLRSAPLR